MKWTMLMVAALGILLAGCVEPPIGGDTDEHGCLIAAGYSWCEAKQKCVREWEEPCNASMTLNEARAVALNSDCMKDGNLSANSSYNAFTKTWWFDLDTEKPGCAPACVVYEGNSTAETNWRCTGAMPPDEEEGCFRPCHIYISQINYTANPPECSGSSAMCTMEYRAGDVCLRFIECEISNSACTTKIEPEFYDCVKCFEDALGGSGDSCEEQYSHPNK